MKFGQRFLIRVACNSRLVSRSLPLGFSAVGMSAFLLTVHLIGYIHIPYLNSVWVNKKFVMPMKYLKEFLWILCLLDSASSWQLNTDSPTDVTYFIFAQHVWMLVHSSSGVCDCVWVYSSGSMCVGVTVWFGWGDTVSLCRLRH